MIVRKRSFLRPAQGFPEFLLLLVYITGGDLHLALGACKGEDYPLMPVINLLYRIALDLLHEA